MTSKTVITAVRKINPTLADRLEAKNRAAQATADREIIAKSTQVLLPARWGEVKGAGMALIGKGLTKKRSKYRNVRVHDPELGNFDSQKEHRYCQGLELRKRAGNIDFYLRQVPFALPGRIKYVSDFVVFTNYGTGGDLWRVEVIDVKGVKTQAYKLKKKQVETLYPVKIVEV